MYRPVSVVVALALGWGLSACSDGSSSQPSLEQTTQFAPVTSPELLTTTTTALPATTDPIRTTQETVPPGSDSTGDDGESDGPENDSDSIDNPLDEPILQMTSALGPTADLTQTLDAVLVFPVQINTPREASIVEVNVGVGSLLPHSERASAQSVTDVVVQVSATMTTTTSAADALQLLGSSLAGAGLRPTDSNVDAAVTSRSYRIPGAGRFDEIVITAFDQVDRDDDAQGAMVRVSYNGTASKVAAAPYQRWSTESKLLPETDQSRTIMSVVQSGEGRLATTTFRVESTGVVPGLGVQREANRLVGRIDLAAEQASTDPRFELLAPYDDAASAPLSDGLRYPGLDDAGYEVVEIEQVDVDRAGELELVDAIEVRITGTRFIE